MDIEEALKFAVDLVFDNTGVRLNKLDKVVLRGILEDRTYREIQETDARSYELDYISRYVAYELRKRLTKALRSEGVLKDGEKVRNRNLWEHLEEALKQRYIANSYPDRTSSGYGDASGTQHPMPSYSRLATSKGGLTPTPTRTFSIPKDESQSAKVLEFQESDKAEDAPNEVRAWNSHRIGSELEQEMASKNCDFVGCKELIASPRSCWGEAPDSGIFYGRFEELATLERWIVKEHSRLVALLGMGGIGKTTLSVQLAKQIHDQFEYVIWRSLRHAPPLQEILADLIEFLSNGQESDNLATVASGVSRLMKYLHKHSCLVILDEVETILRPGQPVGYYRDGYQDYGELLKRIGEVPHKSAIVLTSREKPKDITLLQGETLPVRSLELQGLKTEDAKGILEAKGFSRSENGLEELIQLYRGHPTALKIIATTIQELFNGNISQFIRQNTLVIGDILGNLLNQQFERLSELEKEIMYWLALEQKPVDSYELQAEIWFSVPRSEVLVALESLARRSLIEKNTEASDARFTIQPVVMKYVTNQLIEQVCQDIFALIETQEIEKIGLLRSHALVKDQAPDEVKALQIRLILTRVKDRLSTILRGSRSMEEQLNDLLSMLSGQFPIAVGYAWVNIRRLVALKADGSGHD